MAQEYVFIDEWDVEAPQDRVFEALASANAYPRWWTPIYKEVESDDSPRGRQGLPASVQRQAALHGLHDLDDCADGPPELLRGRPARARRLDPHAGDVRFDWRVLADRALPRGLAPVLRPAFR
jgi:hypothetical protein